MTVPNSQYYLTPYQSWVRALSDLICKQWELTNIQYRLGMSVLEALWGGPMRTAAMPAEPGAPQSVEERARERMRRGLPPPPEIYEAQNRGRIDWMAAPAWARPAEPELFEGCAHEG